MQQPPLGKSKLANVERIKKIKREFPQGKKMGHSEEKAIVGGCVDWGSTAQALLEVLYT